VAKEDLVDESASADALVQQVRWWSPILRPNAWGHLVRSKSKKERREETNDGRRTSQSCKQGGLAPLYPVGFLSLFMVSVVMLGFIKSAQKRKGRR
jgi:hypothetical protein